MGKYKKIGLGLSLLLTLAVGFFIFTPKSYAAGIAQLTYGDLDAAHKNSSNLKFTDNTAQAIEGTFTVSKTHTTITATFTLITKTKLQPFNGLTNYIYEDDSDFCTPADGSYDKLTYNNHSQLAVQFTSLKPLEGKVVKYPFPNSASSQVGLWPGTASITDCGQAAGKIRNGTQLVTSYIPYPYTQGSITVKPSDKASGNGSAFTTDSLKKAKYTYVASADNSINGATIQMTVADQKPVTFVDKDPWDTEWGLRSTTEAFCSTDKNADPRTATSYGRITLNPSSTFDADTIDATLSINHYEQNNGVWECVGTDIPGIKISNPPHTLADKTTVKFATEFALWDVDSSGNPIIDIMSCNETDDTCSHHFQLHQQNPTDGKNTFVEDNTLCGGHNFVLTAGKDYEGKFYDNTSGSTCKQSNKRNVASIMGTRGKAPTTDPGGGGGTNDVGTVGQCDKSLPSFGWLFCPMLEAIDGVFSSVDSSIQGQLNFNVKQNLSPSVEKAWAAMKDISSIFLIIIMLVMVLSQAFGGGPFDAYTVKKLMPKLVVAVIFAQISWPILRFIIGIGNDAGSGLADIMFYPFGGQDAMQLQNLVGGLGSGAPAAVVGGSFFAGILITILNPFGILILALAVVMAVFTAIATLLVRTMLIIGLVIFAPLALLAWILPGTNKYWKMWYDNFSKMLIMFPLIMGLIAVGRIFAWVTTNSGTGKGILAMFAVLIGYFGPYFFLPKTFKWGGSLLSMANQGISKASEKIGASPKKYLETGKENLAHYRQGKSAQRVANNKAKWYYGDQFKSGQWDPRFRVGTARKGSEARTNAQIASYVAKGRKTESEEIENFSTLLDAELGGKSRGQQLLRLTEHAEKAHSQHDEAKLKAAMQRMALLGGGDELEHMRGELSGSEEGRKLWNEFANGPNRAKLKETAPSLVVNFRDDGSLENEYNKLIGARDEELAVMEEYGWQKFAYLARLAGDPDAASRAFERIRDSQSLGGRIHANAARGVNDGLDPSFIPGTSDPETHRPPIVVEQQRAVAAPPAPTTAADPSTIRINHEQNYQINIPSSGALGGPTVAGPAPAARSAFKSQLISDSGTAQTFAHALAYNVDMPSRATHNAVLTEMRNEASVSGSPDRVANFNGVIDQIQQAYTQRINDAVAHVRDSGGDAAAQAAEAQRQRSLVSGQMATYERMRL